ncbi:MAG: leucine-rich repeat domain-containing protein [Treponema sp.]|jgi:hypothetical protein|nr:leucine-rich repeat domain-containing protein [Treponema sp.]
MKKPWLFLACVLYAAPALFAQDAGDFQTELANGQVTIIGYNGSAKALRIPDRINGIPVRSIGEDAFAGMPLTGVTLPNTVTSIGARAFYRTPLMSVMIPDSVTSIGEDAFARTRLTSVTIPNSVTSIGEGAFAETSSLTSVTISNSVTSIGARAFVGCSRLTAITVDVQNARFSSVDGVLFSKDMKTLVVYPGGKSPHYTIPNSVTSIGERAFYKTPLTSVTIPNSVTSIGYEAFASTSLTSVTIPNSVTSIGERAFNETPLTSITIPNSVTSIGNYAFYATRLRSIAIPSSVTSIGYEAFASYSRLTAITVDVQNSRFSSVDGVLFSKDLKTLIAYPGGKSPAYTIPNSVTSIGNYAFARTQLTSVMIPNSVTSIGKGAFSGTQLTSVIIPNSVTSIDDWAFASTSLTSVTIPNSIISIGEGAFANTSLMSVTIPNSVRYIGYRAFDHDVEIIRAGSESKKDVSVPLEITVVNNTGYTFYSVYISSFGSGTWGKDVLGDQVLYDGQSFRYALPSSETWDIRAEDSDGDTYTRRLMITADTTVRLTLEDLD